MVINAHGGKVWLFYERITLLEF